MARPTASQQTMRRTVAGPHSVSSPSVPPCARWGRGFWKCPVLRLHHGWATRHCWTPGLPRLSLRNHLLECDCLSGDSGILSVGPPCVQSRCHLTGSRPGGPAADHLCFVHVEAGNNRETPGGGGGRGAGAGQGLAWGWPGAAKEQPDPHGRQSECPTCSPGRVGISCHPCLFSDCLKTW